MTMLHSPATFIVESLAFAKSRGSLEGEIYLNWYQGFLFPSKRKFEPTLLSATIDINEKEGISYYKVSADYNGIHDKVIGNIFDQIASIPNAYRDIGGAKPSNMRRRCRFRQYRPSDGFVRYALDHSPFTLARKIDVEAGLIDPSIPEITRYFGSGIPVRYKPGKNETGHYLPPSSSGKR